MHPPRREGPAAAAAHAVLNCAPQLRVHCTRSWGAIHEFALFPITFDSLDSRQRTQDYHRGRPPSRVPVRRHAVPARRSAAAVPVPCGARVDRTLASSRAACKLACRANHRAAHRVPCRVECRVDAGGAAVSRLTADYVTVPGVPYCTPATAVVKCIRWILDLECKGQSKIGTGNVSLDTL